MLKFYDSDNNESQMYSKKLLHFLKPPEIHTIKNWKLDTSQLVPPSSNFDKLTNNEIGRYLPKEAREYHRE